MTVSSRNLCCTNCCSVRPLIHAVYLGVASIGSRVKPLPTSTGKGSAPACLAALPLASLSCSGSSLASSLQRCLRVGGSSCPDSPSRISSDSPSRNFSSFPDSPFRTPDGAPSQNSSDSPSRTFSSTSDPPSRTESEHSRTSRGRQSSSCFAWHSWSCLATRVGAQTSSPSKKQMNVPDDCETARFWPYPIPLPAFAGLVLAAITRTPADSREGERL
mmetsp:Transcript_22091/g.55998  ORF Transcript_22091/g.55998 Transcript_22091/m.55998 type:complete len:217 (+) Transcript_22091:600-1250(+)